jgi:hypothetical protein
MTASDDPGDLGIDIRLRLDVLDCVEQHNLARYAAGIRKTGTERPPTQVLEMLLEFMETKAQKAIREGHTRQGARALCDAEIVLRDLVRYGHKEFQAILDGFEGGWRRCLQAARQRLVEAYLAAETPEEELPAIQALIVEIIERGHWPNWRQEYDAAINAEVERRRRSSPSIVPAKAN